MQPSAQRTFRGEASVDELVLSTDSHQDCGGDLVQHQVAWTFALIYGGLGQVPKVSAAPRPAMRSTAATSTEARQHAVVPVGPNTTTPSATGGSTSRGT